MRGADSYNESLFTTVKLESFVPTNHPLRPIRTWLNDMLANMDAKFWAMYEADIKGGAPQHCAGKTHARNAAACAVQRAQRATTGRAEPIQLAVPLGCGPCH